MNPPNISVLSVVFAPATQEILFPFFPRIYFCLNYSFYGQINLFTGKRKENVSYFGFKTFSVCLFTLRTHCRISLNILSYIKVVFKETDSRDRIKIFGHK
jgi:hypothetical protein